MNEIKALENLIYKYLSDTITSEEYDRLQEAMKDPAQREIFEKQFRDHYHVLRALVDPDREEGFEKVWEYVALHEAHKSSQILEVDSPDRVEKSILRISRFKWYAYAAAIALALVMALGYLYWQSPEVTTLQDFADLIPAQDDIVLEMGDGSQKVIQPGMEQAIVNDQGTIIGHQDQNRLEYSSDLAMGLTGESLYNTLTVPYGQRFEVVLSDGTQVYLQAGTSLRFPVRFDDQEFRKVEVVGEAYFEVAKDSKHPFLVKTPGLQVRVTGTQFNVTAYPEDATTDVVLVEGGVQLMTEDSDQTSVAISPGEKGSLVRKTNRIETETVNTELYTSWIDGALVFRQMSFDQIEKKLERYYNIEIFNENKNLGRTVFNAHFKNETIAKVLSFFSDSFDLSYKIRDNTIHIK